MGTSKALLVVLDGFGIGKDSPFNAIKNAKMPFYRDLIAKYPHSQLVTHGEAVGLPYGVMGNSEVGHMTMGAGRIIYQDLTRISKSIQDKEFFHNPVLGQTIQAGAKKTGRVHLMGLLSDGGVHSTIEHLFALLDLCAELMVPQVFVHCFLDGRDTPPDSSIKSSPGKAGTGEYIQKLLKHSLMKADAKAATRARIASVMGRYYVMDRDQRWERVEAAYKALTGQVAPVALSPLDAIAKGHANAGGKGDEFVEPMLLDAEGAMRDGDSVVFFNYRSDRAREISAAMTDPDFRGFDRGKGFRPSAYAGMATYDKNLKNVAVAFPPQNLSHIFGEWLEEKNLTQFRIAETEKYAHVTFFFNGGRELQFKGEDRLLIASPRDVPTYDLRPEMSAFEVAAGAAERLKAGKHDFVLMNFANADMVGHTGNYEAAIKAVECLDQCLAQVIGAAQGAGYHALITADHGNAEEMEDDHGRHHTQHTLNPVPALWIAPNTAIAPQSSRVPMKDGTLEDVMPTLCALMGLPTPSEATGKNLIPNL